MRIFKTTGFQKWATKEGLTDDALASAVTEIEDGLIEANLGGNVYKKRVALQGRGKRSGARTLVAFKREDKAFLFMALPRTGKPM